MRYSGTRCEIAKIRKILNETYGLNYFSVKDANFMLDKICEALVVDEKSNGWIPVSERLPEDGTYITTLNGELVGQKEPFTGMCGIEKGKWDDEDCVIAWMPLPEPYKEGEEHE